VEENVTDGAPQLPETIIKSPPEPTRVKSPEQIVIMRSPDPVFWTVPLDTGKTFTVTQNVRPEGDANIVRPHSEIKVTTPSEPPARMLPQEHPQSAPPELWEDDKGDCKSFTCKGRTLQIFCYFVVTLECPSCKVHKDHNDLGKFFSNIYLFT
jgi:hypothetical protein